MERGMWQYLSLPFCTPRVALSVIGEFLLRLVPEDRMLFYTAHGEQTKISHVISQLCCPSVISSSGGSVLTVEGVGVFLWSPEISGLGGTLLELLELAMCLLSPWGRLVETEEPVVERENIGRPTNQPSKCLLLLLTSRMTLYFGLWICGTSDWRSCVVPCEKVIGRCWWGQCLGGALLIAHPAKRERGKKGMTRQQAFNIYVLSASNLHN